MPFDKDHIDNNSNNHADNNLQILSCWAHRLKTDKYVHKKNEGYEIITKNPGYFIARTINILSKSKHFKKLMEEDKVHIKNNRNNGILIINENYEKELLSEFEESSSSDTESKNTDSKSDYSLNEALSSNAS